MAGERSFISTPGRLQIALAASYITISDRCLNEDSRNFPEINEGSGQGGVGHSHPFLM